MTDKIKIVILDGNAANPGDVSWEKIAELGKLTVYPRTPRELVVERIGDADAVFTNKVSMTDEVFSACPSLKFVGVLATGYNIVDTVAAKAHGVTVCNVPAYSTMSVAQLTFALLLELTMHVGKHSDDVKRGGWAHCADFCYWLSPLTELCGKTIGLVGYGSIGKAVARIAEAFGMNVLYTTGSGKGVPLDELLAKSDVVSLHCPLTATNKGMFNETTFAKMKDGAFFINTARGALVDEPALLSALESGKLSGAGLDVLTTEPPTAEKPFYMTEKIVLTPHIAWATREARLRLLDVAAQNLNKFLQGTPQNTVC